MKLFVIIGEESGEMHACQVLKELKKLNKNYQFFGTGGDSFSQMATCYHHINELNVLGISEALKKYQELKKIQIDLKNRLIDEDIDAVLLVDYAGFNLRFAKIAKELGKTVIFYISPQVWAWKENRIFTIKKYVDHLIVLFSFEVEFFQRKADYKAHYFGHPLSRIEESIDQNIKSDFQNRYAKNKKVALLFGSRKNEINQHIDVMVEAAYQVYEQDRSTIFFIPLADNINESLIKNKIKKHHHLFHFIQDNKYSSIAQCDFAWVVSGTISLEVALLNVPQIILRRGSFLSYFIAHRILKIRFFSLVNILLKEEAFKELIQKDCTSEKLVHYHHEFFDNEKLNKEKTKMVNRKLVSLLNDDGKAYQKTADFINQSLL